MVGMMILMLKIQTLKKSNSESTNRKEKGDNYLSPFFIYNFMKYIKTFESFYQDDIDNTFNYMKIHKVGDIISNETLYNYVDAMHDFEMDNDFIKNHILKYRKFELVELNLDEIDLDNTSEMLVDDYVNLYKENNWYPPIIYDIEEGIIDGYHRSTALDKIGKDKILAWVGVN